MTGSFHSTGCKKVIVALFNVCKMNGQRAKTPASDSVKIIIVVVFFPVPFVAF